MKSIELLVRENPSLTGKEILAIRVSQEEAHKRLVEKNSQKEIDFVKDLNDNGGFYRGEFGIGQYYYYKFTDVKFNMSGGYTTANVESITLFDKTNGDFSVSRRNKGYDELAHYDLGNNKRITE